MRWMLAREEVIGDMPDPTWRRFETEEGLPFWGCSATGAFSVDPPRPVHDTRGGFFCDEPVSLIACIAMLPTLKTCGSAEGFQEAQFASDQIVSQPMA